MIVAGGTVGDDAVRTVLNSVMIGWIALAVFDEKKRAVAEQTVEFLFVFHLVTGEVLTGRVSKKSIAIFQFDLPPVGIVAVFRCQILI